MQFSIRPSLPRATCIGILKAAAWASFVQPIYVAQRGCSIASIDLQGVNCVLLCRISCVGIYVASMVTGKGPYALLLEHVKDPVHHNAVQNLL